MSAITADKYDRARLNANAIHETTPVSELELQARFYSGEFGLAWRSVNGEQVEAVHFGGWNREPGPDFVGARLRVDGEESVGDIELERRDLDWDAHGHGSNPHFDRVILHVFFQQSQKRFFTRRSDGKEVVQVCLSVEGDGRSGLSAPRPGERLPVETARQLIRVAAEYRHLRKRARWLQAEQSHGAESALFQALAMGLGYKRNAIPFLLVAQRVGLAVAAGPDGMMRLFGVAGFIGVDRFDAADRATREWLRGIWDGWWKVQADEERLRLSADSWDFRGVRPSNHPHRRLAALALAAPGVRNLLRTLRARDVDGFTSLLLGLSHPYWVHHGSLGGKEMRHPVALIGKQRAADLAANILAPAFPDGLELLKTIRPGTPNSKVVKAAEWLVGRGVSLHELGHTAMEYQGLIQLYDDFFPRPSSEIADLMGGTAPLRQS